MPRPTRYGYEVQAFYEKEYLTPGYNFTATAASAKEKFGIDIDPYWAYRRQGIIRARIAREREKKKEKKAAKEQRKAAEGALEIIPPPGPMEQLLTTIIAIMQREQIQRLQLEADGKVTVTRSETFKL